jgi:hypothetical protein
MLSFLYLNLTLFPKPFSALPLRLPSKESIGVFLNGLKVRSRRKPDASLPPRLSFEGLPLNREGDLSGDMPLRKLDFKPCEACSYRSSSANSLIA